MNGCLQLGCRSRGYRHISCLGPNPVAYTDYCWASSQANFGLLRVLRMVDQGATLTQKGTSQQKQSLRKRGPARGASICVPASTVFAGVLWVRAGEYVSPHTAECRPGCRQNCRQARFFTADALLSGTKNFEICCSFSVSCH